MKKLINSPDAVLRESLEGVELAYGDRVRVSYDPPFVVRADAPVEGKVGVVSGGGSGHEPMHGGFVGSGMLDAACPGEVFTSPTPDQMMEATKAVDGGAGVLHIVKNYTGDVMNFDMAADLAKGEGVQVEAVVTNDDVAVQDSLYTAGRRGERFPVAPWLAVDPDPDLHLVIAELEARLAGRRRDARRQRHAHAAALGVDAPAQLGDVRQ